MSRPNFKKVQYYGIKGPCLDWIKDTLKNRSQRIVIDGECFEEAAVTSRARVLQGIVLGPILFLGFINYMPELVNSKCRLFADDSIIYREAKSNADCDQLQQDFDSLHEWETLWGMSFNPSKCHIMCVPRRRKPIFRDHTIKG